MISSVFVDRPRMALVIAIVTTIAGLLALHAAVRQQQEGAVAPAGAGTGADVTLLGQERHPFLRVALIVDEDAQQLPIRQKCVRALIVIRANNIAIGRPAFTLAAGWLVDKRAATTSRSRQFCIPAERVRSLA